MYQPPPNSSPAGILQPQLKTSVTYNQPASASSGPNLNTMSNQLPGSTLLEPQSVKFSYNDTKPLQGGMSYQPPLIEPPNSNILQPSNNPVVNTSISSMTEPPPPYAVHEKHSLSASSYRAEFQQQPALMPLRQPTLNQQFIGSTLSGNSSMQSPTTSVIASSNFRLQPQQPDLMQSAQLGMKPQTAGSTMSGNMSSNIQSPANIPTANMLQPQTILTPIQPVSTAVKPQIASVGNFTHSSNSIQMQTVPVPTMPTHPATGNVVDQSGIHSSAMLLPQKTSVAMQYGHTGTNTLGGLGLSQKPLIAATPPVAQTSQGTPYIMSPGANPFSDINDLLR